MIGIIFSNDLNTCPYIDKYLDTFERLGIKYEVIIWNRDGSDKKYPENYRVYDMPTNVYVAKWKKIGGFLKFYRFLSRTIKEQEYEKIVFLTTLTAVLCYKFIRQRYIGKYVFDFRDLSFEQNWLYKKIVSNIIKNSYFTCMSSPGFGEVFGDVEYVMAHNFRYKDLKNINNTLYEKKIGENKISLLHIGITRGEEYNKQLADVFGDDKRFEVFIVGSGNDTNSFLQYVTRYSNIHVKGTYNNEEKAELIDKTDMLLYYYPCDFNCNRALANKYYDCLIYKKPLIGNINTYSGKRLQKKKLGMASDLKSDEFANEVYDYFKNLDNEEFENAVSNELNLVLKEDECYLKKIEEFANEHID